MKKLYIPKEYKAVLDLQQTEIAIKKIKDFFQENLSSELKLRRVTAPLFVKSGTGINDDLNGIERPVKFKIKDLNDTPAEIVHSLAKWKRMILADYKINDDYGIYTDMNAIRPDEELDNIHSLYVDQWDWEKVMKPEERNIEFLKSTVSKIYEVLKRTEFFICQRYTDIKPILPEKITFIHTEELVEKYPNLTPKQREDKVAEKYGAVFIIGIGHELADKKPHDGRAADYDDWSTDTKDGLKGLNGDIIIWNPIFQSAYEISSMGIRVDKESLLRQLKIQNCEERQELLFHKRLINGELPQTIGGGIGQSRLCMFFLRKAHIGEIQASIWPNEMIKKCKENGINIL